MWVKLEHSSMIISFGCGLIVALLTACGSPGAPPASGPSVEPAEPESHYGESQAGSSTTLAPEDLRGQRVSRIEELFQGRVAGVQVIRLANGNFSVRIRGSRSIMGNNEPLFVIDGMPINEHSVSSALAGINPGDVSHIQVLKDPSDTSMYGVRGTNGVVVITTKRGRVGGLFSEVVDRME